LTKEFSLVSSEVVAEEVSRIPDIIKRLRVEKIVSGLMNGLQLMKDSSHGCEPWPVLAVIPWMRFILHVPSGPDPSC
jgi:hypothetical protein